MTTRVDHVVIAVASAEEAADVYQRFYGIEFGPLERLESLGIKRRMADIGGVMIELVEPLSAEDAVGRYLERRGEGLYMLSFTVPSVREARERIERAGGRVLAQGASPTTGRAFLTAHPAHNHGVLVQLVEESVNGDQ